MTRTRTGAVAVMTLLAASLAPTALAAQARPQRPPPRQMERHFQQRFLEMSSRRLSLEAQQTERLGAILERGWAARQELQRELEDERKRFADAIGDPDTSDQEFARRLEAMAELRRREYDLWVSEQRALAEFLTPRQRAMFVQMQLRLNDAARDMRRRRPDGERRNRGDGGGGDPGGPGGGGGR